MPNEIEGNTALLAPLDLMMRGGAIAAMAVLAIVLARGERQTAVRLAGVLLFGSATAFVLNTMPNASQFLGPAIFATSFATHGAAAFLWLFIAVVFADAKMTALNLAPVASMLALGLLGELAPAPVSTAIWLLHNLLAVGLAAHAAFLIWSTWRNDLVEGRRAIRGPFMIALAAYVAVLSLLEASELFGLDASWRSLLDAAAILGFCLVGVALSLDLRTSPFEPLARAQASPGDPHPDLDAHNLERLRQVMGADEAWRTEGLTIGALADRLNMPEHYLRHLINGRLGYRNFAAYLNEHRIEAAKEMLTDPAQTRTSVSAIAFAVGFGSLAPFNRAFREATGLAPTAWRSRALARGAEPPSAADQN